MRYLKTSEAATLLNVSPNTLRAWERRFGYPKPQRSPGHHRLYTHSEVVALRDALGEGLSISSAISRARESLSADTSVLGGALASFELDRADGAMEAAVALRWAWSVRSASGPLPVAIYRRGDRLEGARAATRALAVSPTEAHEQLLGLLERPPTEQPQPLLDEDDLAALLARAEQRRHGIGA